ncbi:MAG TPA: hypothetical protein VK932_04000 [Kofleriaceae bacterium]|nr:hypothetical protein [Kofleriaceae bacterium]
MRGRGGHGVVIAALIALGAAAPAAAEPLPPGSLGVIVGAASGTGVDANRLGFGYQIGGQAAWQPMATENRLGWALKWSVAFGTMYDAGAASVGDTLKTLHMDLMLGVRVRPGVNPSRYLTLRAGGQLLRANQVVPPSMERAFAGGVASVGVDQYAYGFLFNIDVRVNQIGTGPTIIALMFGAGKTGP